MQTAWDYTTLADSYIQRPNYSETAINKMCEIMDIKKGSKICDIGAGAAHLTLELASRGMIVNAVEPNDAMRAHGITRTEKYANVTWSEGVGESTGQDNSQFDAVTFGSSFNVCDHEKALRESLRITKPGGWFACMWNHRDLDDPVQREIENIIGKHIKDYDYGSRRKDQTPILEASNLFEKIEFTDGKVQHQQLIKDCVEAWRSHGTLYKQAGENDILFNKIINEIEEYLSSLKSDSIKIPYNTRIWIAKFKRK